MRLAAIFGCMYLHATVYLCSQVRRYLGSTRGVGVITASIVGATGFTGMVLTDLLDRHPEVRLNALTSASYAGRTVADLFPQLRVDGAYVEYAAERVADSEYVFVCYPHAAAHPVVAELLDAGHKVVDLSADFRLSEPDAYPRWYGFEHPRVDLLGEAVYGIPEQVDPRMFESVPARICIGLTQAEVCAEVDDFVTGVEQFRHHRMGGRMRIAHEHILRVGDPLSRVLDVGTVHPQLWKEIRHRPTRVRGGGERVQAYLGVTIEEVGQHHPCEPGGPHDACSDHAHSPRRTQIPANSTA